MVFDSWLAWFQHVMLLQMSARQGSLTVKQHTIHDTAVSLNLGCYCFQNSKIFRLLNLFWELNMM